MPMVAVNGVTLPVRIDSMQISEELVGATSRNAHGWALRDRRASKLTLNFELTPKSLEEAMLYRALVCGEGEFWSLGTSVYGAKGLGITGTGSHDTSTANTNFYSSNAKGAWALDPTETMIVATPMPTQSTVAGVAKDAGMNGSTLIGWRKTGSTFLAFGWSWGGFDTSPAVKRQWASGVLGAYSGTETIATTATTVTATAPGAGGPWYFSNLLWLPRRFKQAELDLLLAGAGNNGLAAPPLPRVLVTTDLFPADLAGNGITDARTFVALGDAKTMAAVPVYQGGAFDPSSLVMNVELVEV